MLKPEYPRDPTQQSGTEAKPVDGGRGPGAGLCRVDAGHRNLDPVLFWKVSDGEERKEKRRGRSWW